MKRNLTAVSLATTLLAGGHLAVAADYSAGTLVADQYENEVKIKAMGDRGVAFSDNYSFIVAPGTTFVSEALANKTSGDGLGILGLSLQIFDGADNALTGAMTSFSGTLDPGSYYTKVTGTAFGHAGGRYSFFASAVPEASDWQVIALGIGIVAWRLSRRNANAIRLERA